MNKKSYLSIFLFIARFSTDCLAKCFDQSVKRFRPLTNQGATNRGLARAFSRAWCGGDACFCFRHLIAHCVSNSVEPEDITLVAIPRQSAEKCSRTSL